MPALGAAEYTQLVASTLQKIDAELVDQVFTKHPTLDILNKHSKSYTGRTLVANIEAAEDDNTVVTDDSGSFNTGKSPDIMGAAEYQWSNPYVSKVRVEWKKLQMNQGKEQLVDLLEAHVENVKKSHARRIVKGLHKLNADVVAGEFNSFDQIVSNHAGVAEVGGITATGADHFWNATRLTIADTVDIRKAFRTMRNELMVNTGNQAEVTHIIAGRTVFEEFEDSFDDKIRYIDFGKGQTAFRGIYDGDLEVRLDPDCPTDRAYFLDVNSWKFGILNGNFMKVLPAQQITGTLDFVTPIASVLAVGVNQRRSNGLMIRTYA